MRRSAATALLAALFRGPFGEKHEAEWEKKEECRTVMRL